MTQQEKQTAERLRTFYILATVAALWTVFIVVMQFWFKGSWMMTVSSLLLMVFVGLKVGHEIVERRRMLHRLTSAQRRDHEERIEHHARAFFGALMKRMEQDDDEEE